MLVRLLYASRAVDPQPSVIESILAQSRQFNPSTGITGILVYGGGIFLQAIEGGRSPVSDLYGHIQQDKRHKDVVLLHYEEITERRFGGWTMGQVNMSKINASSRSWSLYVARGAKLGLTEAALALLGAKPSPAPVDRPGASKDIAAACGQLRRQQIATVA